MNDLKVGFELY